MESPKDQLIELYYQRVIAMSNKIEQLQNQLNNYEKRKN
jgi:conjugal transfer/entry exclusion protein